MPEWLLSQDRRVESNHIVDCSDLVSNTAVYFKQMIVNNRYRIMVFTLHFFIQCFVGEYFTSNLFYSSQVKEKEGCI